MSNSIDSKVVEMKLMSRILCLPWTGLKTSLSSKVQKLD